jgi:hypothetical protein
VRDSGLCRNDSRMGCKGVESVQPLQRFLTPTAVYRCHNAVQRGCHARHGGMRHHAEPGDGGLRVGIAPVVRASATVRELKRYAASSSPR